MLPHHACQRPQCHNAGRALNVELKHAQGDEAHGGQNVNGGELGVNSDELSRARTPAYYPSLKNHLHI